MADSLPYIMGEIKLNKTEEQTLAQFDTRRYIHRSFRMTKRIFEQLNDLRRSYGESLTGIVTRLIMEEWERKQMRETRGK